MCAQDCRTWLWGGEGNPDHACNGEGQCSCICDDERWSNHNILGRASCIPKMAHLIFGWLGLVLSVAALCHAAYQLQRQLQFHAQDMLAPALPLEKCRRLLHLIVVTFNVFNIGLFSMVLWDEVPWSCVLLSAIQILPNICGVLGARLWMDTTRPGQNHPNSEIIAVSAWLESPTGHYAPYIAVSIVPVIATILAGVDHPEAAIKMTAVGVLLVSSMFSGTCYICGKALLRGIDESLKKRSNAILGDGTYINHEVRGNRVDSIDLVGQAYLVDHVDCGHDGDRTLLRAKKKVKRTLDFVVLQLAAMYFILGFAIFSKHGTAEPLLLFVAPVTIVPTFKLMGCVQLFAGRSKLNPSQGFRHNVGGYLEPFLALVGWSNVPPQEKVVPMEIPSTLSPPPSTPKRCNTSQRTSVVPY